jgi:serine/threonine protein kinase
MDDEIPMQNERNPSISNRSMENLDATQDPLLGREPNTAQSSRVIPTKIGRFVIRSLIGQGGFGQVYLAIDPEMDREVAIKIPLGDQISTPEKLDRFLREARAAGGIHHPNVCPVYEIGQCEFGPYLVMPFIAGKSLKSILERRAQPLSVEQAVSLIRRIAAGLQAAHVRGIVHRDLKPDNILFDRERKEPLITDFGLARMTEVGRLHETQDGKILGTPSYMSPEQVLGEQTKIGVHTDIYSLGVLFFELLTSRSPFQGSAMQVMGMHLQANRPIPSEFRLDHDNRMDSVILKAMAREVSDRFKSIDEFLIAVDHSMAQLSTITYSPTAPIQPSVFPPPTSSSEQSVWSDVVLSDDVINRSPSPSISVHQSQTKSTRKPNFKPLRIGLLLIILLIGSTILVLKNRDHSEDVASPIKPEKSQDKVVFVDLPKKAKPEPVIPITPEPKKEEPERKLIPKSEPVTPPPAPLPTYIPPYEYAGPTFGWRVSPHREKINEMYGLSPEFESVVKRGITWIRQQQKADGSWAYSGTKSTWSPVSATAFALLTMLGQGDIDNLGVQKGFSYLLQNQQPNGRFGLRGNTMYEHGIATIAICEAAAFQRGKPGTNRFLSPAQRAIKAIEQGQSTNGSWGYLGERENGDTSILGWQVQAYHAAKLASLPTSEFIWPKVNQYLDSVYSPTLQAYGYSSLPTKVVPSLTGIGTFCRRILSGSYVLERGTQVINSDWLTKNRAGISNNLYTQYYLTEVLKSGDVSHWRSWRDGELANLMKQQLPNGSWKADGSLIGVNTGILGSTCFAILILESCYRYPEIKKPQ